MVHLTEAQLQNWHIFHNKIPVNTFKYLMKIIPLQWKELEETVDLINEDPTNHQLRSRFDYLQKIIIEENKTLTNHNIVVMPPDQKDFCSIGTAVKVKMLDKEKWVIPDVCFTSAPTISINTPLCREILGKKVGEEGTYLNNGEKVNFKIVDILSYSETKQLFFKKQNLQLA